MDDISRWVTLDQAHIDEFVDDEAAAIRAADVNLGSEHSMTALREACLGRF